MIIAAIMKRDRKPVEWRMCMIKVSVIVPVYNVEAYLEACLEALVKTELEGDGDRRGK